MGSTVHQQGSSGGSQPGTLSKENKQALLEMIQGLPIMAYRCLNDRNWTMQRASDACEEITGLKPSELVNNKTGKVTYLELMHPEDRDWVWRRVQVALRKRSSFAVHYRIVTPDKNEKWVLSLGHGIFEPGGDLYAVEGQIIDLSHASMPE
jgi:PAS domain S-box-containing protein